MPVIVFASPKGGAGKTTSSFILSTELAERGAKVTLIDADPNHPIIAWEKSGGKANNLKIEVNKDENNIIDTIEEAKKNSKFVIVDLEGTANLSVAYAISRADLVIIPSQRSTLDAGQAAKAVKLVRDQIKAFNKNIPAAVLLTRTSPAIRSKGLKRMIESLDSNQIDSFVVELTEREAFKAVFDHATTLYDLRLDQVSGIDKARYNSAEFAAEVIGKLKHSHNNNEVAA